MRRVIPVLSMVSLVAVLGCGIQPGDGVYTTDPSLTTTPDGQVLLSALSEKEVDSAMIGAAAMIQTLRAQAMDHTTAELRKSLIARGIDPSVIKDINEAILGKALPSDLDSGKTTPSSDGYGSTTFALSKSDAAKHFKCPLNANGKGTNLSCDALIKGVVQKVKDEIAKNKANVENHVKKVFGDLSNEAQNFITAWGQAALEHGSEVAAVYAEHELRAAAKCDQTADGNQVSYMLGVQQGHQIVLQMRAWAKKQVSACVVNIDEIIKQVRFQSLAKIDAYMKANKVCENADISQLNEVFQKAEVKRKEGIRVGVKQQVEVLRSELLNYSYTVPCSNGSCWGDQTFLTRKAENECKLLGYSSLPGWIIKTDTYTVCCRQRRATKKVACVGQTHEGKRIWCKEDNSKNCLWCQTKPVPVGSPIAIDLGNDGLQTGGQVTFDLLADGAPQNVTWIGKGEALLALDINGNGRVDGGAELFGNATDCGGEKCYDGVVALTRWDRKELGGNSDGMIDSRDRVYRLLRLWIDANSDGVTQAGELSTLASHGVRAISLKAVYETERRSGASITSSMQVLTDRGVVNAYDVWFAMKLKPSNLKSLLPL